MGSPDQGENWRTRPVGSDCCGALSDEAELDADGFCAERAGVVVSHAQNEAPMRSAITRPMVFMPSLVQQTCPDEAATFAGS